MHMHMHMHMHTCLQAARLYFPTREGLAEYELASGSRLRVLKGHFGATTCCAADPHAPRVFSGGEDGALNAWTPPPCGLRRPAPAEPFVVQPFWRRASLEPPAGCGGGGHEAVEAAEAGGYGLTARGGTAATMLSDEGGRAIGRLSAIAASGTSSGSGGAAQPPHTSSSSARPAVAADDVDAWSDDDDDAPPAGAERHRGREQRGGNYNKRRRQ